MGENLVNEENQLTFEDGVLLTKYIFQCAIQKTLNGVPEQWHIFYKTHEFLEKIQTNHNQQRLNEVLYHLNMDDIFQTM